MPEIVRRTFLFGAAATFMALAQKRSKGPGGHSGRSGTLAYVRDGTLWIKRLPGGQARAVATGNAIYEPRFSPSGRWILFRDGDDLVRIVAEDGTNAKSWIGASKWLPGRDEVAVSRGDRTVVLGPEDDWSGPRMSFDGALGTVSPDRAWRVWQDSSGQRVGLFMASFGNGGEPELVAETEQGGFAVLGFIRGASRFLYWMTDEDGADVWAYPLDIWMGGGTQAVKTGVTSLMGDDENMISLSPTGDTLAATVGGDNLTNYDKSIALIDVSADSNFAARNITGPAVAAICPAWSPDGRRLVWAQGPDENALENDLLARGQHLTGSELTERSVQARRIWVAEDRGLGKQRQLTNDPAYVDEVPVWSRDGNYILFGRTDRKNTRTLWLMRADGSDTTEVAAPAESPDSLLLSWPGLYDWSLRAQT